MNRLPRSTALAAILFAVSAQGQTVTQRRVVTFKDSNLSVWSPTRTQGDDLKKILIGPEFTIDDNEIGKIAELWTPEIDARPLFYIRAYSLGKTGATLSYGGKVKAGITFKPWYDGGKLEYTYQAGVDVTYPRLPISGASTTVTAAFKALGASNFSTTSPNFGGQFGAVGQIKAHAETEAWIFDQRLWKGSVFDIDEQPAETPIGGKFSFGIPDELNFILGEINGGLNPLPIGVELSRPDLTTNGTAVASDGTLTAEGFGKFLTVSTDLLSWATALLPPALGEVVNRIATGDYLVPFTDIRLEWAFIQAWANLDVGMHGKHVLGPKETPKIYLQAFNTRTGASIGGPSLGSVNFIMPIDGARIEPTLDLSLGFKNRLALGTGGSIGFEPMRIESSGSFGKGDTAINWDFDFSVGSFVWEGEPSGTTKLLEDDFLLPAPPGGRVRTLAPVGIRAFDGVDLAREVFGQTTPGDPDKNQLAITLDAYSANFTTGDIQQDYRTASIFPEQGRSFFAKDATFGLTLLREGRAPLILQTDGPKGTFDTGVQFRIPTVALTPGQHTVEMKVATVNTLGQPRSATYLVPLTVYNPRVTALSPALFTQADLAPSSLTNRVAADGTTSRLYLGGARGVLPNTQIVLDGEIVLPNNYGNTDELALASQFSNGTTVGFELSPSLKARLAGAPHEIRLRAPGIIVGSDGVPLPPFESDPIPIFMVAGLPTITGLKYEGATTSSFPIVPGGGYEFDVVGTNFTQATKVTFALTGAPNLGPVETTFASPTTIRVRLSAAHVQALHSVSSPSAIIGVSTRRVNVPADASHPAAISGGSSSRTFTGVRYPAPRINRLSVPGDDNRLPIVLRGEAIRVRVYGDNLFRPSAFNGDARTTFTFDGEPIASFPGPSDGGLTTPYFDMVLPARSSTRRVDLRVSTQGGGGSVMRLVPENPRPSLTVPNGGWRVRTGNGVTLRVAGGPFYNGATTFRADDGARIPAQIDSTSSALLTLGDPLFRAPNTTSFGLRVVNETPGGGESEAIRVAIDEGDFSKISVTKGVLTYDRASRAWKQSMTLVYNGDHNLANVNLQFRNLPRNAQLLNGNGLNEGWPYKRVAMKGRTPVVITALFRRVGPAPLTFNSVIRIP